MGKENKGSKDEGTVAEEYRGVTLTQTTYKVYTVILAERLRY